MSNLKLVITVIILIGICSIWAKAQGTQDMNRDPETVRFITSDIDNFWRAYDLAAKETERERKVAIFQTEYLDKGSVGLKDFLRLRIKSAEALVKTIESWPKFYASIRTPTQKVERMVGKMRASFREFKKVYPEAVFPDVYFLIGVGNSGGTTGATTLLVGTEMYGRTPKTPLDELSTWLKNVLGGTDKLPAIVAHESCHFNQSLRLPRTLLAKAVQEGSCDLISELIAGGIINTVQKTYGDSHEADLWREFQTDMNTDRIDKWMYNGATVKDKPADLGYYIGYRITSEYYRRAKGKKLAVREILNIQDLDKFFAKSRYNGS